MVYSHPGIQTEMEIDISEQQLRKIDTETKNKYQETLGRPTLSCKISSSMFHLHFYHYAQVRFSTREKWQYLPDVYSTALPTALDVQHGSYIIDVVYKPV